jgi:hypothetical protein
MEDLYEYMRETIANKLRLRVRAFSRRQVPECPSYPGMTMSFTHTVAFGPERELGGRLQGPQ